MTDNILAEQCCIPPKGWRCIREKGHEGPCAATPTSDREGLDETLSERDLQAMQAVIDQLWANKQRGNAIAAQMRRAVDRDPPPPLSEFLMLLINGASEIDRLEALVKHIRVVRP